MLRRFAPLAPIIAFAIVLAALIVSLYLQYTGLEPCVLCWWQRIFIYPLVILIPIGIWRAGHEYIFYTLPLAVLGALVALYHTLLYYGVVSEALAPCTVGIPCTAILPDFLGFNLITASLASFSAIIVLLIIDYYHDTI
jgi:disulfide bond formation protein DsbB